MSISIFSHLHTRILPIWYYHFGQKRETKETIVPPLQVEYLGRQGTMFYVENKMIREERASLVFNTSHLWDNTFIQACTVGLASYHFESSNGEGEQVAYISYEHEKCSYWPALGK